MALLVGELQARITADRSQHARELKAAEQDDKSFKARTAKDKARIDGDEKPFTESTKRAITAAGVMRTKVGSFMGELRGELLAVGAVAGIVEGFRAVVMAASDLSESANAISQIFGTAADSVFDFTSTASSSIGQSDTEARNAMATFGAYGKQAGLASDQNAAFSQSLVKLASDLASFKNTTPTEAIEAIGAAFRGESDPIEKYNVLINESVIQQRALKMGVIETTSQALTPAQRVLVAYEEILAQTKDAQGDFGRTSGELANQLRTLRARVIDQSAALGQDLLPAAKSVVSFLNGAVGPAFDVIGGVLKGLIGTVGEFADAWNGLPGPIQAGIAALLAWRLLQDRVVDGASSLGDRLAQPWRTFADEVRLHTALAARDGEQNISKLSAAMSVLQSHDSVIGHMAASYRDASAGASQWLTNQNALTVGSNAFMGTLRGMAPAFDGIVSRVAGVTAAIGTGLRGAMSSLMGVLGGPWGIAIAAGTFIIGQWVAANQRAKAKQEELAAAGRTVAKVIAEQNGVLNQSTRQAAAKAAEEAGLLKLADRQGISLMQVTDAIEGQAGAYEVLRDAIDAKIEANNREQDEAGFGTPDANDERIKQLALERGELEALKKGLDGAVGGRNDETAALIRTAQAAGLTSDQISQIAAAAGAATEQMSPMAQAMATMADESASAEDKISALQQALDAMTEKRLSVEEATQAINDTLREMGKAFDDAKIQASDAGVALLDASGAIDTTTAAGSELQDKLVSLSSDYNGLFAATVEAATAQGKTLPEALVAAAQATGPMRQKFLDIADAAGLNADQVALLTEHYGMLPKAVATAITQPGMMEGIMNALGLGANIRDIPNGWQTILTSTAPEQIALMESLGFKVTHLPNGDVLVTADTAQAWAEINKITTPKTLIINLQAKGFSGAALGSAMKQYGGGFANGGYMPANPIPRAVGGGVMPRLPYKVGEIGEEIIWPDREGFVSTATQTRELLRQMSQIDRRMVPATVSGGAAMGGAGGMYGGDGAALYGSAGRSGPVIGEVHMHAVQSVPTMQQMRDLTHEMEVLYG